MNGKQAIATLAARGKSGGTGFQPVFSRAGCPCHTALGDFRHGLLVALLVGSGGLAGCNDPRAVAPTRTRLERIDYYCTAARDRENEGPRRLAHMSHLIEDQAVRDDAHVRRDLKLLDEWSRRDVQRWHDRQPRYRADLMDAWDGNLEMANDVIPRMFY
ncbi:MAG: hypothetical protein V2A79_07490 [Planctomycetota bacterium]